MDIFIVFFTLTWVWIQVAFIKVDDVVHSLIVSCDPKLLQFELLLFHLNNFERFKENSEKGIAQVEIVSPNPEIQLFCQI